MKEKNYDPQVGVGAVIVAALAALIAGLAAWVDATTPNSTKGVSVVDKNVARLPVGETFVLTHQSGKIRDVWDITFDGKSSVRFHCESWACDDFTVTLNGVGNTVDDDAGWGDHFYITLQSDGAVYIQWPWGWDYRAY